jgi:CheY-like chemotaxis protein
MDKGRRRWPLRVLIVDDCRDTTRSLEALLTLWGHEVRVAHEGGTALRLAEEYQPEVVLLDLGLPGMDGWEVARRLRHVEGMAEALVVAVTGYGRDEDRRRSHEAGCDYHLLKPVDLGALEKLLAARRRSPDMPPEELVTLLTSLGAAAEVIEALDNRELQAQKGWPLANWRYESVPWGVLFRHYTPQANVDAEIEAVSVASVRARSAARETGYGGGSRTFLIFD